MAAAQISCEYCLLRTQWQALLPRLNLSAGTRASNEGYPKVCEDFTITEKAHTRVFFRLKVPTRAFTFKTLCSMDVNSVIIVGAFFVVVKSSRTFG